MSSQGKLKERIEASDEQIDWLSQGKLKERIEASDEQIDWLARSKILEILGEVKATFPEYPTAEEALTEMGVTGTPSKAVINELQTVANLKRIFTWFREWFGEP